MFFDEFSMTNKTTTFYSWGYRNRVLKIKSKEGYYKRINGFLSINMITGKEYLEFCERSKAENIREYIFNMFIELHKEGYKKCTLILDNNKTHKDNMRYNLWLDMRNNDDLKDFEVEYINTPPYSPDFNLVEYGIKILRQKYLHHLPSTVSLFERIKILKESIAKDNLLSIKSIYNIISRFGSLIKFNTFELCGCE